MEDMFWRLWANYIGRLTGPLTFRLYLQPAMSLMFAVRDGLRDARAGRPAFLWRAFSHAPDRRQLVVDGWKSIGRIFILALVIDVVYQLIELRWVYPLESIGVAFIL